MLVCVEASQHALHVYIHTHRLYIHTYIPTDKYIHTPIHACTYRHAPPTHRGGKGKITCNRPAPCTYRPLCTHALRLGGVGLADLDHIYLFIYKCHIYIYLRP